MSIINTIGHNIKIILNHIFLGIVLLISSCSYDSELGYSKENLVINDSISSDELSEFALNINNSSYLFIKGYLTLLATDSGYSKEEAFINYQNLMDRDSTYRPILLIIQDSTWRRYSNLALFLEEIYIGPFSLYEFERDSLEFLKALRQAISNERPIFDAGKIFTSNVQNKWLKMDSIYNSNRNGIEGEWEGYYEYLELTFDTIRVDDDLSLEGDTTEVTYSFDTIEKYMALKVTLSPDTSQYDYARIASKTHSKTYRIGHSHSLDEDDNIIPNRIILTDSTINYSDSTNDSKSYQTSLRVNDDFSRIIIYENYLDDSLSPSYIDIRIIKVSRDSLWMIFNRSDLEMELVRMK